MIPMILDYHRTKNFRYWMVDIMALRNMNSLVTIFWSCLISVLVKSYQF
jgi:hypothetical protein